MPETTEPEQTRYEIVFQASIEISQGTAKQENEEQK